MFITFVGKESYMFRLITLLCFVFFLSPVVRAQHFTIDPDTLLEGTAGIDVYTEYYIYMHPAVDDTLNLSWRLVGNTFPEDWVVSLCDYGECYTGVPNTGDMIPLPPDESAYLKVILNPYGTEGTGRLSFWVYETDTPDEYVTVHFDISTEGATTVFSPMGESISVFPNPATQYLIIDQGDSPVFQEAELVDLLGRPLLSRKLKNEAAVQFDLSSIATGTYLLRLTDGQGLIHVRKVRVMQ
jgi:hypothetical protein